MFKVEPVTHVSLKKHYFAEQFCVSGIKDKLFIAVFFYLVLIFQNVRLDFLVLKHFKANKQ